MLPMFLALSACLPASHPGIAVEAITDYPGITTYAPHWGATTGYIAAAHAKGERVIGVHGLNDSLQGMSGYYDEIVLDELIHHGQTVTQTASILDEARVLNPGTLVGVVEPYAADTDALLESGVRPDFVSGETYGGDVTMQELDAWALIYGVQTQMWATGTDTVMAWENRVDLVIAANLDGSWGGPVYGDDLYTRLGLSCQLALPVVAANSNSYP